MVAQQGSLDGLCGVYSIINAMDILLGGLKKGEDMELFSHLISHLGQETGLDFANIVIYGMRQKILKMLVFEAYEFCKKRRDLNQKLILKTAGSNKINRIDFMNLLKHHLHSSTIHLKQKNVVILGKEEHWTCVSAITAKSLILADSSGANAIRLEKCLLKAEAGSYKKDRVNLNNHIIWPTQTFLLLIK